jgi:hypothetical protein
MGARQVIQNTWVDTSQSCRKTPKRASLRAVDEKEAPPSNSFPVSPRGCSSHAGDRLGSVKEPRISVIPGHEDQRC